MASCGISHRSRPLGFTCSCKRAFRRARVLLDPVARSTTDFACSRGLRERGLPLARTIVCRVITRLRLGLLQLFAGMTPRRFPADAADIRQEECPEGNERKTRASMFSIGCGRHSIGWRPMQEYCYGHAV